MPRSGLHCQYVQPPSVKTKSVQKLSGPVVDVSPSPQAQASAPETEKQAAAALADAAGEVSQGQGLGCRRGDSALVVSDALQTLTYTTIRRRRRSPTRQLSASSGCGRI